MDSLQFTVVGFWFLQHLALKFKVLIILFFYFNIFINFDFDIVLLFISSAIGQWFNFYTISVFGGVVYHYNDFTLGK